MAKKVLPILADQRLGEEIPAPRAPKAGEQTDELLAELGYSEAEIARLRKAGAI